MGVLSYLRMVLWSFFGIRRRAAATEELSKVNPLALIGVAVVLAGLFILVLWGVASLVARSAG
ncbi:MAG: DUF2970 domain-containing protein [Burkholderiaceae bacterium]